MVFTLIHKVSTVSPVLKQAVKYAQQLLVLSVQLLTRTYLAPRIKYVVVFVHITGKFTLITFSSANLAQSQTAKSVPQIEASVWNAIHLTVVASQSNHFYS
jgi:hypothetical protein